MSNSTNSHVATTMDNSKIPVSEPSICIPRTINSLNWRDVKDTMEKLLGKGTVDRVDIVTRRDDDSPFCRIFIHMRYWDTANPQVEQWRNTLLSGGEIKVVYNHPWFWKCVASRIPKPDKKKKLASDPYIMLPKSEDKPTLKDFVPTENMITEASGEI